MSIKLTSRLKTLGLSTRDASKLESVIQKQIQSRGTRGAIDYLKKVGEGILNYLYGTPSFPTWLAKTRSGFPKCISFMKDYPEETLLRISKIARYLKYSSIQESQIDKVVTGVTADSMSGNYYQVVCEILELGIHSARFIPRCDAPTSPPILGQQFRRVQSVSGPVPVTMEPPFKESLELIQRTPALQSLEYIWECFTPLRLTDSFVKQQNISDVPNEFAGEIHASQEGGGKLRMYAAPYTLFQCLLSPIHSWIDSFRRKLATDCTYDQTAGALWAQEQIRQGTTVYSVDLSTATCRFPLDVQLWLLTRLGLQERFVKAFQWVSQAKWKVGEELVSQGFPEVLQWKVGQPLGIRPSMSSFSLTHNLLLAGLCVKLGISPKKSFRILGDDVVLVNLDLYHLYTDIIGLMGIPISWSKTHASDKFAEFAGYCITSNCLVRPGQWRNATIWNHLELAMEFSTPLEHEVGQEYLLLQKLWLFHNSKYSPIDPLEWNRLMKASSMLVKEHLDYPDFPDRKPWFQGVMETLVRQFGSKFTTSSAYRLWPQPEDCFKPLPEGHHKATWIDVFQEQLMGFDSRDAWSAYICAKNALNNLWYSGYMSDYNELGIMAKAIDAKFMSLFWLPPVSDRFVTKSLSKRLAKLLATE